MTHRRSLSYHQVDLIVCKPHPILFANLRTTTWVRTNLFSFQARLMFIEVRLSYCCQISLKSLWKFHLQKIFE